MALRYPRGEAEGVALPEEPETFEVGKGVVRREGDDVAILAFGRMVGQSLRAAELLQESGVQARVVDMRWAKPIDEEAVLAAAQTGLVVTVEENVVAGGAGCGVLEVLARHGSNVPVLNLGLPDSFVEQGKVDQLFAKLGLDGEGIAQSVLSRLGRRSTR